MPPAYKGRGSVVNFGLLDYYAILALIVCIYEFRVRSAKILLQDGHTQV